MAASKNILGLDVGEKRIGVALADSAVKIAVPLDTIEVDGSEIQNIASLVVGEKINTIVVGYPRNQAGLATSQTIYVEKFVEQLEFLEVPIEFQDESLTSVMAEDRLKAHNRPYSKGDIDAQAAAIILQDYMEEHYG